MVLMFYNKGACRLTGLFSGLWLYDWFQHRAIYEIKCKCQKTGAGICLLVLHRNFLPHIHEVVFEIIDNQYVVKM